MRGDFDWHHDFQIGLSLPPFGEEGLRSNAQLDFVERSSRRDSAITAIWARRCMARGGTTASSIGRARSTERRIISVQRRGWESFGHERWPGLRIPHADRPPASECGAIWNSAHDVPGHHGESGAQDPINAGHGFELGRAGLSGLALIVWRRRCLKACGHAASGAGSDKMAPGVVLMTLPMAATDFANTVAGLAQSNGRSFAGKGCRGRIQIWPVGMVRPVRD